MLSAFNAPEGLYPFAGVPVAGVTTHVYEVTGEPFGFTTGAGLYTYGVHVGIGGVSAIVGLPFMVCIMLSGVEPHPFDAVNETV